MRINEYYRLAKISLKERKKSTRSTVSGLAFGFIILLPIIVCLLGVNISFNKQLNNQSYLLFYNVSKLTDYRIQMDNYENTILSGSENIDFFDKDNLITNKIVYEQENLIGDEYSNTTKYSINGTNFIPIKQLKASHYSIIDVDKSDSYFPKNLTDKFPDGIFIKGYDKGFTNQGKKQVIVSETMLKSLNINAEDIYQKELTISSDSFRDTVNSQEMFSAYICKDYTVVGIIKNEITALYRDNDFMSSNLFFTSVNVYENQQGVLKPYLAELPEITITGTSTVIDDPNSFTYENYDNKEQLNEEYMMLGSYGRYLRTLTFFTTNIYIEADNYADLANSYSKSEKYFDAILFNNTMFPLNKSALFEKYQPVYEFIVWSSYIFLIVAVVIILVTIVNIYVTIKHSIKNRRFYFTMLRAIGAKNSFLPKLYMMEHSIIVTRANLFIIGIGLLITSGIKILLDYSLRVNNVSYDLSISWLTISITTLSIVLFLYIVAFLFSFIGTYKLSRKPIVDVLTEKG